MRFVFGGNRIEDWFPVEGRGRGGFQERAATEYAWNQVGREFPLVHHIFQSGA